MHISSLSLTNYKNYTSQVYDLHNKLNLVVGLNGVGKTNLLDAVYYTCIGKSYLSTTDRYNIRKGENFLRLEGIFYNNDRKKNNIAITVEKDKKKTIKSDGKNYKRISEHVGNYPCVMISPTDVHGLLDASEERRKFIDQSITQYDKDYLRQLLEYNKLLKQRNALLKQFAEQKSYNKLLINTISEKMERPAQKIHEARKTFVDRISSQFSATYKHISEDKEQARIEYKSSLHDTPFLQSLSESNNRDRILQRTTKGIHKDDLKFIMNDDQLKVYASQGQLKSFIMALKLSQYKIIQSVHKNTPILLLDDIFDKLDQERVKFIIDILLKEDYGQIFISDTNLYRVENILQILETNYHKFVIENTESISLEKH